jgi:hypothetical protein
VAIKGAAGHLATELLLQDAINNLGGAPGLLLLQVRGSSQQRRVLLSWLAPVAAATAKKARHPFVLQTPPLPPQGPRGDTSTPTVGQEPFLLAQLLEIPLALIVGNLSQPQGAQ